MTPLKNLTVSAGVPHPFGTTPDGETVNFSLYSKYAEAVTLCLFAGKELIPLTEIPLDPEKNRTGDVWHIALAGLPRGLPQEGMFQKVAYGYKIAKRQGKILHPFYDPDRPLLDPFAKAVASHDTWGEKDPLRTTLGVILPDAPFDWEGDKPLHTPSKDLIIYEMHVRGFTQHTSSSTAHPGTYAGIVDKIPYLKELGINAIKLMPIHTFDETEYHRFNPFTGERLYNYWGYSTVNYFAPMHRYSASKE